MSDALSVMLSGDGSGRTTAETVIQRKIPGGLIKQRDAGGGKKLNYISGSTVINLLNEAFGYTWSFEVVNYELIKSEPKFNKYKNTMEDQPPYFQVLGRLSVPGFGIKEQFGTKILLGGASEQEGAMKSATTDAMKKCATLFGIGIELYEDEVDDGEPDVVPAPATKQAAPTTPAASPKAAEPSIDDAGGQWEDDDIERLDADIKKLVSMREKIGVVDNLNDLNPFVQEFLNNKKATYKAIGPKNIVAFNEYLEAKMKDLF